MKRNDNRRTGSQERGGLLVSMEGAWDDSSADGSTTIDILKLDLSAPGADSFCMVRDLPALFEGLLAAALVGGWTARLDWPRSKDMAPATVSRADDAMAWLRTVVREVAASGCSSCHPISIWLLPRERSAESGAAVGNFVANPWDESARANVMAAGVVRISVWPGSLTATASAYHQRLVDAWLRAAVANTDLPILPA